MKILLMLFVLFLSKTVFSEILLSNIKLYENVNNYFSKYEINEFNAESDTYGFDTKYSQLYFTDPSSIFDENFTLVMVIFENKTKEIEYVSGLYENLNNCIKFRDEQISISTLNKSDGETASQKHDDGLEQNLVMFRYDDYAIKHSCDYYSEPSPWAGTVDYRFDYHTWTYSDWITEIMGTTLIE